MSKLIIELPSPTPGTPQGDAVALLRRLLTLYTNEPVEPQAPAPGPTEPPPTGPIATTPVKTPPAQPATPPQPATAPDEPVRIMAAAALRLDSAGYDTEAMRGLGTGKNGMITQVDVKKFLAGEAVVAAGVATGGSVGGTGDMFRDSAPAAPAEPADDLDDILSLVDSMSDGDAAPVHKTVAKPAPELEFDDTEFEFDGPTLAYVRTAAEALLKTGGHTALNNVLGVYGVIKISEVPEDQRKEFIAALHAATAAAVE